MHGEAKAFRGAQVNADFHARAWIECKHCDWTQDVAEEGDNGHPLDLAEALDDFLIHESQEHNGNPMPGAH